MRFYIKKYTKNFGTLCLLKDAGDEEDKLEVALRWDRADEFVPAFRMGTKDWWEKNKDPVLRKISNMIYGGNTGFTI